MPKPPKLKLAAILVCAAGTLSAYAAAADEPAAAVPAAAQPEKNLKGGLSLTAQLLQLMDTDKNGKVSKAEFLHFMEQEFDLADKNKDGELDPKELRYFQYKLSHPAKGPGR